MINIDLRSDTVTQPTKEMRQIMSQAVVGDDVYGEDPTVNKLEKIAAEITGFEDGIFAPSGTQANLIGLLSHCQRGDEYIVGQHAHTYKYEGGGAAVLGSIQPQPIEFEADSTLDLKKVAEKIKPDDIHFAKTRLLCLENTQNGKALPLAYLEKAGNFAKEHKLRLHLDGARLFNATVKQNIQPPEITGWFDSVSICLSKGLGTPAGSVLCGSAEFISEARRWRKMLGGGMRQAGILASAGIYALQKNVARLRDDQRNAELLTEGLSTMREISVERNSAQTNMAFFNMDTKRAEQLALFLREKGILISPGGTIRMVTHLDISRENIFFVVEEMERFFKTAKR